jgi:hypothetical protein
MMIIRTGIYSLPDIPAPFNLFPNHVHTDLLGVSVFVGFFIIRPSRNYKLKRPLRKSKSAGRCQL